jgi:hypothetical protein
MFSNIVPLTTVGTTQVLPSAVIPSAAMTNSDLLIIQDTATTSQAELINQLQNHITENQQILIITDDQGQDQCKSLHFVLLVEQLFSLDVIIDKDQDINALLQNGKIIVIGSV